MPSFGRPLASRPAGQIDHRSVDPEGKHPSSTDADATNPAVTGTGY